MEKEANEAAAAAEQAENEERDSMHAAAALNVAQVDADEVT